MTIGELKKQIEKLSDDFEIVVSVDVMPNKQSGPSFVVVEVFKDPRAPEVIIRCDQSDLPTSVKNENARIKAYVKNWKPQPGDLEQAAAIINDQTLAYLITKSPKSKKEVQ